MRAKSSEGGIHWCLHGLVLLGALLWLVSCESGERYAGTYKAGGDTSARQMDVVLELKENGEGTWRKGDEEIPFSWYVKSGELRLNTKGGGVLVGKPGKDAIDMTLPGGKTVAFKKVN